MLFFGVLLHRSHAYLIYAFVLLPSQTTSNVCYLWLDTNLVSGTESSAARIWLGSWLAGSVVSWLAGSVVSWVAG